MVRFPSPLSFSNLLSFFFSSTSSSSYTFLPYFLSPEPLSRCINPHHHHLVFIFLFFSFSFVLTTLHAFILISTRSFPFWLSILSSFFFFFSCSSGFYLYSYLANLVRLASYLFSLLFSVCFDSRTFPFFQSPLTLHSHVRCPSMGLCHLNPSSLPGWTLPPSLSLSFSLHVSSSSIKSSHFFPSFFSFSE